MSTSLKQEQPLPVSSATTDETSVGDLMSEHDLSPEKLNTCKTEKDTTSSQCTDIKDLALPGSGESSIDQAVPNHQIWPRRIDSNRNLWIPIQSVNPHIVCGLCQGYLYEACTITECMHSFCRNCLVRHIQRSLNCPMCAILIHPTDPFVHIRLDGLLQNIVYALLPDVEKLELERERIFYEQHDDDRADSKKRDPEKQRSGRKSNSLHPTPVSAYCPNKFDYVPPVSLCLQCLETENSSKQKLDKQFVRVTGAATIRSLSTFLKKKLKVEDSYRVNFYCPCRSGFVSLSNGHTLKAVKDLYSYGQDIVQLRFDINEQ